MDYKSFVLSISMCIVAIAAVNYIMPSSKYKKTISLIASMIFTLMLISPIVGNGIKNIDINDVEWEIKSEQDDMEISTYEHTLDTVKTNVKTEILKELSLNGINASDVRINIEIEDDVLFISSCEVDIFSESDRESAASIVKKMVDITPEIVVTG